MKSKKRLLSWWRKPQHDYWKTDEDGTVTIIIAAYMRYQSLKLALRSVYGQTYPNWKVLVICDHCDSEFERNADLTDSRVRFINLPKRCGHQYGPNSVGIHLADSEYIAFLNHDDTWLSDHLETAIGQLRKQGADFFLGKAAFCHHENQEVNSQEKGRLMFSELNRPEAIWRCIKGPNGLFEPASSWVIRNTLSKKIGYWRPPDTLGFTPVMDWIQRAARAGARFAFGSYPTVLKFNLHHVNRIDGPRYRNQDPVLDQVEAYLHLDPGIIREYIREDLSEAHERKLRTRSAMWADLDAGNEKEAMLIEQYERFVSFGGPLTEGEPEKMSDIALRNIRFRTGEKIESFDMPEMIIKRTLSDISW